MEVGSPFGSRTRTRVLLVLETQGQSHLREHARRLPAPLSVVQKAVRSLERDGLVAGRPAGRTRLLELAPGYFALPELRGFLKRLARAEGAPDTRGEAVRRQPRRKGEPPKGRPAGAVSPRPRGEGGGEIGREMWRVW